MYKYSNKYNNNDSDDDDEHVEGAECHQLTKASGLTIKQ